MTVGLPAHASYRDIGLPWLRRVPKHWQVRRGKNLLRCIDERSQSGDEELLTVSSTRGVVPRRSATVTMFEAQTYQGHKLCWPGDLVVNSLWAWAGGLGVSPYHGIVSTAYGVYRPCDGWGVVPAFVHYLVRSVPFQWELQVRSKGVWTSRLQLTDQSFLDAPMPVPPIEEQDAIVRYLGYVDRRIGRYIGFKQRQIRLLEEQKQLVIYRAVTGQTDVRNGRPYASYKDSGVEELGQVPEHWQLRKIRRCLESVVSGLWGDEPSDSNAMEQVVCVRVADFDVAGLRVSTRKLTVRAIPHTAQASRLLQRDDILMEKSGGGDAQPVGRVVLFNLDVPAVTSNFVSRLRVDKNIVRPKFLLYVLAIWQARRLNLPSIKQTTGIQNLDEYDYFSTHFAVPTLEEQDAIVSWIDKHTDELGRTIDQARNAASLLREYRTCLIADVVTGKLDVREAAVNLPNEVEQVTALEEEEPLDDASQVDDESGLQEAREESEA